MLLSIRLAGRSGNKRALMSTLVCGRASEPKRAASAATKRAAPARVFTPTPRLMSCASLGASAPSAAASVKRPHASSVSPIGLARDADTWGVRD